MTRESNMSIVQRVLTYLGGWMNLPRIRVEKGTLSCVEAAWIWISGRVGIIHDPESGKGQHIPINRTPRCEASFGSEGGGGPGKNVKTHTTQPFAYGTGESLFSFSISEWE